MKKLLTGNEAIARGAWEAGLACAFGYPGTPSTEIIENLSRMPEIYSEWSPNEKVALEAAAGAAIAGSRTLCTMKLVGLNVAADPLMTLSYIGINAGLVIVVADDPGQHSSQTEQDTRHFARLAKVPVIEASDAAECAVYIGRAFEISERYRCPVIFRTTTCVSHSRFPVELHDRVERPVIPYVKNVQQFVPVPVWGRKLRAGIEDRMVRQAAEASSDQVLNPVIRRGNAVGIISFGVTALHCLEIFPEASLLKLGWSWPFPDRLIREFAQSVEQLLIVEEGDPILEEHIRSLGITCTGKEIVPRCGELTPRVVANIRARYFKEPDLVPEPVEMVRDLPARPPILCAGCPHRGLFYALTKFDVIVTGDIGCYTLGVFPPLSRTDTCLCMGAGFSMAHGISKTPEKRPVVGIVGDSTFFHSGITGLLDLVYNRGNATLVVVDNRTTAMTGHQEHPGTGHTAMGDATAAASIEKIAEACGMKRIRIVDPFNHEETVKVLKEELEAPEPSLIISRALCVLKERSMRKPALKIDADRCKNCRNCLKLGCPAIESAARSDKPVISDACTGCGLCQSACPFDAIH